MLISERRVSRKKRENRHGTQPATRAYDALIAAVALANLPLNTVTPSGFQDIEG